MIILAPKTDTFDQVNTFSVAYKDYKKRDAIMTCYLFLDEKENKYYILQKSACLKSHYTEADIVERVRLQSITPIKNGDSVQVGDKVYTVKIVGNYSDAGYLIEKV